MQHPIRHNIFSNASVAAAQAVPTAALANEYHAEGNTVVLLVFVTGVVSGTTPSLTFSIEVSADGVNWFQAASGAAITVTGAKQRLVVTDVVEPLVRVNPQLTGTASPTFAGTYVDLLIG